MKGFHLFCRN